MNPFGGFAIFCVLAVASYFLWRWVRTTSLYAILFDTRSPEPTPDNRAIIGSDGQGSTQKVTENLRKGWYPKSEYKLPPGADPLWKELYATQPFLFKRDQRPESWGRKMNTRGLPSS